jgi:hypothetical protein
MSDLLDGVLAAHGGLNRWERVSSLVVTGSLGGPFWAAKGWPDVYRDQRVTVDARAFDITFEPYPGPGQLSHLRADPERLEIRDASGEVVQARDRPRESFPSTERSAPWDAIQTAYFTSCAMWNYLMAPFLFTFPGVVSEEIAPWDEDGTTWRRLAVTFPAELPNHNPDQVFYFDDDLLLRRLDYRPEVTDAPIAHYTDGHRTFDGLVVPTRRRVYVRDAAGHRIQDVMPITIDIEEVAVVDR